MAVNELDLTVVGWVGNEPLYYRGEDGGVPFTRFRVASTPRVYDREHEAYVDGGTSWFTVKAFRSLARNVADSVRRGDPVVVHGRLALTEWLAPDGTPRTTAELTADSVGHDLSRGTTRFSRTVHEQRGEAAGAGRGEQRTDGAADPGAPGAGSAAGGRPVDVTGALVLADEDESVAVAG